MNKSVRTHLNSVPGGAAGTVNHRGGVCHQTPICEFRVRSADNRTRTPPPAHSLQPAQSTTTVRLTRCSGTPTTETFKESKTMEGQMGTITLKFTATPMPDGTAIGHFVVKNGTGAYENSARAGGHFRRAGF